jgi:hypothetical protein
MAAPCHLLLLPAELRVAIYQQIFHNFILEIVDEDSFRPYGIPPEIAANQLSKVNKQIRLESVPVLAACTKVIAATILLPQKDGLPDPEFKPKIITPRLHPAFLCNIRGISVSLQSTFVPGHKHFPGLKKIAVDAWLYGPEPIKDHKDKDLVRMVKLNVTRPDIPEEYYPVWMEKLEKEKSASVKLALREVWKLNEDDSNSSYLVSQVCRRQVSRD